MTTTNYKLAKSDKLGGRILVPSQLNISCIRPIFSDVIEDKAKITTTQTVKLISYMQGNDLIFSPVESGKKISDLLEKYSSNLINSNDLLKARSGNVTKKMLRLTTAARNWLKNAGVLIPEEEPVQAPVLKESSEPESVGIASKSEEEFLAENINYYLDFLNLKPIDFEETTMPIHYLSTIGDSEVAKTYFKYVPNRRYQNEILTNQNMKLAMLRLGFYELHDMNDHLVGSLFETLYAIAIMQESVYAISVLENALFGNPLVYPDHKIVFKTNE